MNERIKELALQASKETFPVGSMAWMEMFAELIVRECLTIAREEEYHSPFEGPVETKIKQHFGVEE